MAVLQAPAPAALDLHEGICDPPQVEGLAELLDQRTGCLRWPEPLWLRNVATGELARGRCRATNLCPYCRILAVVETAEMLWLDAAEWAPTLWIVLTAREHLARRDTYAHLRQLRSSLRKRWPSIEWFVQVEFQRRGALHLNLLIKGVDVDQADELLAAASRVWCRRVDALPVGQHIEALSSAQAVTRYLQKELSHGLKREQAPPIGWRGHRTSQTRGYLVRPASVMRQEARRSLRSKRELWKARQEGLSGPEAERRAQDALAVADAAVWVLWQLPGVSNGAQAVGVARPRPSRAQVLEAEAVAALRAHTWDSANNFVGSSRGGDAPPAPKPVEPVLTGLPGVSTGRVCEAHGGG
jgi:hypothetical protein